jgi:hypothetical protein
VIIFENLNFKALQYLPGSRIVLVAALMLSGCRLRIMRLYQPQQKPKFSLSCVQVIVSTVKTLSLMFLVHRCVLFRCALKRLQFRSPSQLVPLTTKSSTLSRSSLTQTSQLSHRLRSLNLKSPSQYLHPFLLVVLMVVLVVLMVALVGPMVVLLPLHNLVEVIGFPIISLLGEHNHCFFHLIHKVIPLSISLCPRLCLFPQVCLMECLACHLGHR